jgi:1-acyl-sn-glycerol-3-phosphate acyltransferase
MTRGAPAPPNTRAQRMARLVRHLAGVYGSAVWRAPRLEPAGRRELAARFAREMLAVLQVRLHVRGTPRERTPTLIVANHVSWLDMYALNAVGGARFVAKSEVREWPFFGTIARRFDTLFIVRGSYRDAARVRTEVAHALREGARVVVFPEGTTNDGTALGRFYPALFQSAIDARVPVQPVAIRYHDRHGERSAAPVFVGDTSVLASVTRVVREPSLSVEVTFGPPLSPLGSTRKALAERARRWIGDWLGRSHGPLTAHVTPLTRLPSSSAASSTARPNSHAVGERP